MAADEKWYFTKDQLANTPSRKYGYDADRELSCRQQAANFIQDMGQRLQVTQLCINTAIVYMHRFYVFHSFSHFHRNDMAVASLFLAAKVEEQPRKLEHVIKVAQMCLHREQHQARPVDTKSEQYLEQAQDLVINENILLQTLGFDVAIDHPHTHVVKCCHLVRASKDLAQTSYFMASNSLHLTTMCLLYKPTVVACFCIHLACKWSNWEIPQSNEGKSWFWYVDRTVTQELLEQLTDEFLRIFDKCSSRLKRKITSISASHNLTLLSGYPFPGMDRKRDGQQSNIPNFHAQPVQQPQSQPFRSRTSGAIIGPPRTIVGGGDDLQKRLASTLGPLPQAPQSPSPSPQTHQKTQSLDFKKTTPTTHHSRDTGNSSSSYHGNGTPSNTNMPNSSTPSSSASFSSESPSIPPSTKHSSGNRPEYIFPPPTRSTHHSGPPRTEKQDRRSPTQQSHYKPSHPVTHHPSRNGTSHSENSIPPDTKTFTVNHLQKNHVKGHDAPRQMPVVNSESVSVNHRSSSDVKTIINSVKTEPVIKTEPFSPFSVQPPITRQPPPPPPPVSLPPPTTIPTKPSSIFSPEKVTPPSSNSPKDIKPSVPVVFNSTIKSPTMLGKIARNRTSSSSSEPELVPFMSKLEDMTGFESIARGKTAIKLTGKVPDLIPPREKKRESTPVISNAEPKGPDLLRPFPVSEVIETVAFEQVDTKEKAHKKKKKRKEHKEHKDRDKDKEKDKKKHKEKHRVKHSDPAPIKITIPKDKLNQILPLTPSSSPSHDSGHRLKIKIPKEKLLTPSSGLKIKISSKDGVIHSSSKDRNHSSSRKRERTSSHDDERPSKMSRQSRPNEQIMSTNDSM